MESMRDIKTRIKSVESTMQITKALELVAASKLKAARRRAEDAKPYFKALSGVVSDLERMSRGSVSVFFNPQDSDRHAYIVIAGDRGLAGGYNNNIFKQTDEVFVPNDVVLPIGKKAVEHYSYHHQSIFNSSYQKAAALTSSDCMDIAQRLTDAYKNGEFSSLSIVYTKFVTVLTHIPEVIKLLPLTATTSETAGVLTIYEPSADTVLENIVPQYISGILYGALSESLACELAARRIAMESANSNAEEIIEDLSLKYNRARQASITQELTEIMSAAAELS